LNILLNINQKIKTIEKDKKTSVLTSAPVCSKTRQFLNKNKVEIQKLI